jgi:hypothetical protein
VCKFLSVDMTQRDNIFGHPYLENTQCSSTSSKLTQTKNYQVGSIHGIQWQIGFESDLKDKNKNYDRWTDSLIRTQEDGSNIFLENQHIPIQNIT